MHPIDHDIAVTLPANRHNYSVVASPLEQQEDEEEEEDEEVPEATKSPSVFFFLALTENFVLRWL